MNHARTRATLATAVLAAALAGAAPAQAETLKGTFKLKAGKYKNKKASGTYFKMIYPKGSVKKGPFFSNPDSKAKKFTLLRPGIDGGLRTGVFQQPPTPAFDSRGFALSNRIVRPTLFAGIKFSLSTAPVDGQSGQKVGVPTIKRKGSKLSGDLRGFTATWNNIYFNQGSPKPNGKRPGKTSRVKGTFNRRSKRFVITWTSQIVGGPFNDFVGYWHLAGTYKKAGG